MTEYVWTKCGGEFVFCDRECSTCIHNNWTASDRTEEVNQHGENL
jgi:hypothetical protein